MVEQRFVVFRKLADGTPVIIVEKGHWHDDRMWAMRLQKEDVMSVARGRGIRRFEEIETAIVERNGTIAIYKKENSPQTDKDRSSQREESERPEALQPVRDSSD